MASPITHLASVRTLEAKTSSQTRALRKRAELLDSLERLDGHLASALKQLSLTLATATSNNFPPRGKHAKLHMMVLQGASLATPKARTVLEINGMNIQSHDEEAEDWEDSDLEETASQSTVSDEEDDYQELHVPLESSSGSDTTGAVLESSSAERELFQIDPPYSIPAARIPLSVLKAPTTPSERPTHSIQPISMSEHLMRSAERSLYRTLATSSLLPSGSSLDPNGLLSDEDSDDEDELPLTTTLVFIRAPRRFQPPRVSNDANDEEPTFIPRGTHSMVMDEWTRDFFHPSALEVAKVVKKGQMGLLRKVQTRGVRVNCEGIEGIVEQDYLGFRGKDEKRSNNEKKVDEEDEGDEMIWWQWNGKLAGIGDEAFV